MSLVVLVMVLVATGVIILCFSSYKDNSSATFNPHLICDDCKGNGYLRVSFEAEEHILQCSKCHSEGIIKKGGRYEKI
tara:strand:+ start:609 stop:842 length:234 start_codon:yes stop_codon:yes gene_type:complete